jgi:hypothetical protein
MVFRMKVHGDRRYLLASAEGYTGRLCAIKGYGGGLDSHPHSTHGLSTRESLSAVGGATRSQQNPGPGYFAVSREK